MTFLWLKFNIYCTSQISLKLFCGNSWILAENLIILLAFVFIIHRYYKSQNVFSYTKLTYKFFWSN